VPRKSVRSVSIKPKTPLKVALTEIPEVVPKVVEPKPAKQVARKKTPPAPSLIKRHKTPPPLPIQRKKTPPAKKVVPIPPPKRIVNKIERPVPTI
jgi:hypothetical protein